MLRFNQFLKDGGLDPTTVRLLRHRPEPAERLRRIRDAAFNLDVTFQRYQERQVTPQVVEQFRAATYLAGFIADALSKQTVFVGLWKRLGERKTILPDPFYPEGPIHSGSVDFETRRVEQFDPYVGRLCIEWGDGTRAWVQRADKRDKRIVELRKERSDPDFIGFAKFLWPLNEIPLLYSSWIQVLRSVKGVYLLVHRKSGDQYVGSACGDDGFFGRWSGYANGHGGNVALKELAVAPAEYDVSVLEVVGSDVTRDEILHRESIWKNKLGTRATGLNRN